MPRTADDDLRSRSRRRWTASGRRALLFACNGRGTNMFAEPDHDAGAVAEALGSATRSPASSAPGEIGPVGGKPFLHGFTATLALFLQG